MLNMFQATLSLIIRSFDTVIIAYVLLTCVVAGRCHGWAMTAAGNDKRE